MRNLPRCADVTRQYSSKFSGVLLVDGKYVKVKGYERKIPVLYGIDYMTHDIPTFILSRAENYQTCHSFFSSLRLLNYPLQAVVCDDNVNIYEACWHVYPKAVVQLCQNHYKQNIRLELGISINPSHRSFMKEIEDLFSRKRSRDEFRTIASRIYRNHLHDPVRVYVMADIQRRISFLTAYTHNSLVPRTNNLIESYNSHFEGRLKTMKGFKSFSHANDWLNAYFIYRRIKPFTDCEGKFKKLNGHSSLEQTMKDPSKISEVLKLFR